LNLSLEALFITVIFLVPGFFVYYTRQYTRPALSSDLDNFELSLLSLGYSAILSVFQAFLFAIPLRLFNFDIAGLVTNPATFFVNNYLLVVILGNLWILTALTLAFLVGVYDPYLYVLQVFNKKRQHTDSDIWHNLLMTQRTSLGENTSTGVTVHLKNGDLYMGYLNEYETKPSDGNREFILKNVTFGPADKPHVYLGQESYVLLNTREVDSIDFHFLPTNEVAQPERTRRHDRVNLLNRLQLKKRFRKKT
jgi:hypothetical protein